MATDTITKSITAGTWAKAAAPSGADEPVTVSGREFFVCAITSDDTAPTDISPEYGMPAQVQMNEGTPWYWLSMQIDDGDELWVTTIWKDAELGVHSPAAVADA